MSSTKIVATRVWFWLGGDVAAAGHTQRARITSVLALAMAFPR
jgi:hypothetical protein